MMTATELHPHFAPSPTTALRLSALGRRVSASGPLAVVLADLAYGPRERDQADALHHATRARVAAAAEART